MVKNLPRSKRLGLNPCVGKIPLRRTQQPTPVLLPGEAHGQRSLVGSRPWGHKESDTTEVTEHARVVALFSAFGGTSTLFSIVAVPVYIGRWILNAWTTRGNPQMQT